MKVDGLASGDAAALWRALVTVDGHQQVVDALTGWLPIGHARLVDAAGTVLASAGQPSAGAHPVGLLDQPIVLHLTWTTPPEESVLRLIPPVVAAALARLDAEASLRDLRDRGRQIQALAKMGDFEWDVRADVVTLSPELLGMHGRGAGSSTIPYAAFLDAIHPEDREQVKQGHLYAMASGEPYFMTERILIGDDVRVLDTSAVILTDRDGIPGRMRGVCVDVTGRWRIEDALRRAVAQTAADAEDSAMLELRMQDARLRRRQAVDINDNIIQGLTAAVMAVEAGQPSSAGVHLQRTLDASRRMMADLLAPLDGADLDPDDLIRERTDNVDRCGDDVPVAPATYDDPGEGTIRVLLVDDADDLRVLFRFTLEADGRFHVVGEAADGVEAISRAEELQPDVVLLDVAMPRLDGVGALPRIMAVAPKAVVIMLSGFGTDQMAAKALEAGAHDYIEKGAGTGDIIEVISRHLPIGPGD